MTSTRFFRFSRSLLIAVSLIALLPLHQAAAQDDMSDDSPARPAVSVTSAGANSALTALEVRITTLENSLRQINGMVERAQYAAQQAEARYEKMSSDDEIRFEQMQKEIDALRTALADDQAAPAAVAAAQARAEAKAKESSDDDSGDDAKGSDKDAGDQGGDTQAHVTPQQLYDQSFALLRQAKYAEAEAGFKAFLAANPNNTLANNARYWLGETYYVRGKFDDAAMTFAESYQKAPKGPKAADSLLKLGMSLGAVGKKQDACVALQEVNTKYPNASATVRSMTARELQKLSCQQ